MYLCIYEYIRDNDAADKYRELMQQVMYVVVRQINASQLLYFEMFRRCRICLRGLYILM